MMKKMKRIMKDEEGLTLVELLAVVVILAIIAGIAAISISRVIQRTREDAQVSNVQQMLASANLYDIQVEAGIAAPGTDGKGTTTLDDLKTEGSIKSIEFLADKEKASEVTFEKDAKNGVISMNLPAETLEAGNKKSKMTKFSEEDVASLTRDELFEGKTPTTPSN